MNSIRPLFTITILVVVAIYLYLKINEGPTRPVVDRSTLQETGEGVPPLDAIDTNESAVDSAAETADAVPPVDGEAPQWNAEAAAPLSPESITADDGAPRTLPAVPEIPALPEVATPADAGAMPASDLAPAPLPKDIPMASYPGDPASTSGESGASVPVAPNGNAASSPPDIAPIDPTANVAPPSDSLEQTQVPAPTTDRYGNPVDAPSAAAPAPPSQATGVETFAASWPAIQDALDQGELARAHQLLSPWYGKPTLTPAEQEQVETLLSQLAGTVVYSTEHQLEPAHVVQQGETLETIAAKYNVPWQLLAKVNGLANVGAVQPGQQLKVMRGPFSAIVDLADSEVSLSLDGRYAGRFPIVVPADIKASEGEWMVMQKIDAPNGGPERSLLLRPLAPSTSGEPDGLVLGALKLETLGADGVMNMSPADANEIADILSVGSRVMIRR